MKVRGQWTYLYRAVDKLGNTIDFYLSPKRNAKVAKRFLGKALNGLKDWEKPTVINTDKAPTYAVALAELKGDTVVVWELDRLSRPLKDVLHIMERIGGPVADTFGPR